MIELAEAMDAPNTKRAPLPGHVLEAVLDVWSRTGEQHFIPITGNSMLPLIQDGDHVLVAHGCAGVRQGDVVVFRREGRLIAHRALRIHDSSTGPTFVTKGDNASQFDPPLSTDEIVGRVLAVERGGRYMSLDTAVWRVLGWLIAVSTLAWTRLYGWSRALKQNLLGPQPNRLTAFLRRSALASFSLAFKVVQVIVCRWKAGVIFCQAGKQPEN
jgi:signal peptidase I